MPPYCGPIYYDDFTFTPDIAIGITNTRVSGALNGTSQNAMVGADVALNANPIPSSRTGGAYSWTFSGPYAVSGGATNSSSVVIRSTDVGTITATVNYTLSGVPATASVTINAVLPTLTSFTGQQGTDSVYAPGQCVQDSFWWYKLGCLAISAVGMHFSSTVHAVPFISDPTQSGIKYVQAVSGFRKKTQGDLKCQTQRTSEGNIASGWQLDTSDPYNGDPSDPLRRFSEGNDLTMVTVDYPRNALTFIMDWEFVDSLYIDDRFEMYVVYFTGDPAHPPFQRPLGKLTWNWGGLVVFDPAGPNGVHHIRYTNAPPTSRTGEAASSMVTMQGNVTNTPIVACPGGPPVTNNHIDSSRVFVKYHYIDFLGRHPAGEPDRNIPPDLPGWNFWTSNISRCVFDLNCIHAERIHIGLAFMTSPEFTQTDPIMANPPGSPGFNPAEYNPRFVYWCYRNYLKREPDAAGWQNWTNVLNSEGSYAHIIEAFEVCSEYRDRSFF